MSLYTFPNATNPDEIVTQTSSTLTQIIPMFLLFVWSIIFIGGTQRQKSRIGTADYPMWSVFASLVTLMFTALLSVSTGFINLGTLVIVAVITLFCGAWLFLDRRITEG